MNPTELSTKEVLKKGPDLSEFSIHKEPVDTKTQMPMEATRGNDDAASQAKGSSLDGPAGTILELLKSLEEKLPRTQKNKVTSELQNWVRLLEAGSSGEHAKEHELVKSAVRSNSEVMGPFAGMYLTKYEIEMLENLAPFAGSSPRRGLRFVNVYRLIKSSFKSEQLMGLVDTKGEKLGYRALITQLAISTGAPKIAQYYFQLIIGTMAQISSLEELLNQLGKEPRITTSPEWVHLRGALDKLKELNEDGNLGVGSDMILALGQYAPIARRYSFTARPV